MLAVSFWEDGKRTFTGLVSMAIFGLGGVSAKLKTGLLAPENTKINSNIYLYKLLEIVDFKINLFLIIKDIKSL